ncbi:MAG: Fe-S cluster assembly ATPase SufC [Alphaproteobacteria bacterium]|nr:Fe-S cluster assembly ATPase SufC [Alphaproteobacteria bacterium]
MDKTPLLEIEDLCAQVDNKEIIKNFNLTVNEGEIHAIMGPNGAGKSTLSYVLCGKEGYEVTSGNIRFKGQNLLDMNVEQRARAGLFLIMQHPVEIPGVSATTFLKHAVNDIRKANNLPEIETMDFIKDIKNVARNLNLDNDMLKRSLNVGFSGGEKKRMEALQMSVLKPDFSILDEADSGLDIDALKTVAKQINSLKDEHKSMLIITHFQRLLNYIEPDFVHIFAGGRIVKSGDKNLAIELEQNGYSQYVKENA